MRIIVNESQYNKILIKEKKNTPTFDNWVNYMSDVLATHIHQFNVKEDVNTHTNLSNKLRGKTFFKELPIENFIINLVENVTIKEIKIRFNPYWSLLVETPGTLMLKDVELDVELPSKKINGINEINIIKNQLHHEFIKINRWRNSYTLLKEQEDNDPYVPYTWDESAVIEFDLWDDISKMNNFFNKVIGKKIHIIGGEEGSVTIKDEFDLAEKKALELANTALTIPMYLGFEKDSEGNFIHSENGIGMVADKEKFDEEERLRAEEEARLRAEEEARLRAEEEAEALRVYITNLQSRNVYFINFDDVAGMRQGTDLGEEAIKGEYPIFEKIEDIPDDFHNYFKYALVNTRDADLNTLSDEDIMTYHPPEVEVYTVDGWEKNDTQFVQPIEIIEVKVKGRNGNLNSSSDLKSIGPDKWGTEEYLAPEAADKYEEMKAAAAEDGIEFELWDAYRECGHPDDYDNGKWSQWYAWIKKTHHRGPNAARPSPDTKEEWIEEGGGKCTSNHGLGKAIDLHKRDAQKWVTKYGCKYNWWWGEAPSESWHFTYYDGIYSRARGKSKRCGENL